MTAEIKKNAKANQKSNYRAFILTIAITGLLLFISVFLSDEISSFAKKGLSLAIKVIIPSVFPFLLLTDVAVPFLKFDSSRLANRVFEKTFNVSATASSVLLCGLLCGFPIGPNIAISLYRTKRISKCECERLVAFCNNASPGYVISAVGIGLYGSLRYGLLLYASVVLSSVITGALVGIKKEKSSFSASNIEQSYNFTESVKSAASICLTITGFITAFSVASGILCMIIDSEFALSIILPFLEIGNAVLFLSSANLPIQITLSISSFAIAFSGLSVFAQMKSLLLPKEISILKYLSIKLLQGIISLFITFFLFFVLKFI